MVARLNWNESFSWAPALQSSRESLEFRSSAPADCCIAGCPQRRRRRLRRGPLTRWLMKTCLCVTFNISHRVFHLWPTRNDVQPNDLTCKTFSVCKFLHTKPCLRTLIWLMQRLWDVFAVTVLPMRNFWKYGDVSVYNVWHASPCTCPEHNFPSLYLMRLYKIVSTVRRDDVHVFIKMTDLCTIFTYKDVPRPNVHIGERVCI